LLSNEPLAPDSLWMHDHETSDALSVDEREERTFRNWINSLGLGDGAGNNL